MDNDDSDDRLEHATDQSLVRRFREGQDDAATALYLRYARRLERLADGATAPDVTARADPEGIVQSVFRTFFRRAAVGQYDAADGNDLWKLFLVIALNKIRSSAAHHRAQKRDVSRTRSLDRQEADKTPLAENADSNALAVLQLTIDELLSDLPAGQRPIIELRIEGHDIATIAEQTKRSKRSVERILQNFRETLRNELDEG